MLQREGFLYSGPVAQAKKGRQQADQAAKGGVNLGNQASGIATTNQGIQQGYRAAGDTAANNYFGKVDPNTGLGKATTQQYELDKSNIERNATDSIGVAQRMAAQRGMQGSPGAMSSIINTTNRNAGQLETGAYNTALQNQQQLGLQGIGYNVGQQQLYNPLSAIGTASSAYGQGGNSAAQRAGMGSGVGDVIGGVSSLAGSAGSVMTGMNAMNKRRSV